MRKGRKPRARVPQWDLLLSNRTKRGIIPTTCAQYAFSRKRGAPRDRNRGADTRGEKPLAAVSQTPCSRPGRVVCLSHRSQPQGFARTTPRPKPCSNSYWRSNSGRRAPATAVSLPAAKVPIPLHAPRPRRPLPPTPHAPRALLAARPAPPSLVRIMPPPAGGGGRARGFPILRRLSQSKLLLAVLTMKVATPTVQGPRQ